MSSEFIAEYSEYLPVDQSTTLVPRKYAVALCSRGMLGLITSERPHEIKYKDGKTGRAWTGIQLGEDPGGTIKPGKPWSSRTPTILFYLDDLSQHIIESLIETED